MTPLEQTFWCQQYKVYIEYESKTTTKWDISRKSSLEKADLDLEEFRKRFGGDDTGSISDGYHTFDELYEFRKLYNAALFNEWTYRGVYEVHKSKLHYDGTVPFGGGWFIVCARLNSGQISNHYDLKDWGLFHVLETPKALWEFDGHNSKDVANRLRSHIVGETQVLTEGYLSTATDILNRNNQTGETSPYPWPALPKFVEETMVLGPKPTLYPWELLPEWVEWCAVDEDGITTAFEKEPVIEEDSSQWFHFGGSKWECFDGLRLPSVTVPNWRLSLEKRPGGGV